MKQMEEPLCLELTRSQVDRVIQALDCAIDHAEQAIISADTDPIHTWSVFIDLKEESIREFKHLRRLATRLMKET
jgi:hypothetical protein